MLNAHKTSAFIELLQISALSEAYIRVKVSTTGNLKAHRRSSSGELPKNQDQRRKKREKRPRKGPLIAGRVSPRFKSLPMPSLL